MKNKAQDTYSCLIDTEVLFGELDVCITVNMLNTNEPEPFLMIKIARFMCILQFLKVHEHW